MVKVKSVGVLSMGKMMGIMYALIGLIAGGIVSLMAMAGVAAGAGKDGGGAAMLFGTGAIIMLPLFYGVMGFIGGIIMGFIYNIVAGIAGGIEMEISQ